MVFLVVASRPRRHNQKEMTHFLLRLGDELPLRPLEYDFVRQLRKQKPYFYSHEEVTQGPGGRESWAMEYGVNHSMTAAIDKLIIVWLIQDALSNNKSLSIAFTGHTEHALAVFRILLKERLALVGIQPLLPAIGPETDRFGPDIILRTFVSLEFLHLHNNVPRFFSGTTTHLSVTPPIEPDMLQDIRRLDTGCFRRLVPNNPRWSTYRLIEPRACANRGILCLAVIFRRLRIPIPVDVLRGKVARFLRYDPPR